MNGKRDQIFCYYDGHSVDINGCMAISPCEEDEEMPPYPLEAQLARLARFAHVLAVFNCDRLPASGSTGIAFEFRNMVSIYACGPGKEIEMNGSIGSQVIDHASKQFETKGKLLYPDDFLTFSKTCDEACVAGSVPMEPLVITRP